MPVLNTSSAAIATGAVAGGLALLVSLANLALPPYGQALLEVCASIYPGYEAQATAGGVVLVTAYAAVDGVFIGFTLAWLYNRLTR
jgi:O-acetyl-ADP-ribose deacetylase (regulator of RNase III)